MDKKIIVMWAPIELKEGVDEETFLKASDKFQADFVEKKKGFIKRDLLKGKDGGWVDLIFWEGEEEANQLLKAEENSSECLEFFKMMKTPDENNPDDGFLRFERIRTYNK